MGPNYRAFYGYRPDQFDSTDNQGSPVFIIPYLKANYLYYFYVKGKDQNLNEYVSSCTTASFQDTSAPKISPSLVSGPKVNRNDVLKTNRILNFSVDVSDLDWYYYYCLGNTSLDSVELGAGIWSFEAVVLKDSQKVRTLFSEDSIGSIKDTSDFSLPCFSQANFCTPFSISGCPVDTTFQFGFDPSEGKWKIMIQAKDAAFDPDQDKGIVGNISYFAFYVLKDTTPPRVSIHINRVKHGPDAFVRLKVAVSDTSHAADRSKAGTDSVKLWRHDVSFGDSVEILRWKGKINIEITDSISVAGSYYYKIVAFDSAGNKKWEKTRAIYVHADTLPEPVIRGPDYVRNAVFFDIRCNPIPVPSDSLLPDSVRIQMDNDPDFSSPELDTIFSNCRPGTLRLPEIYTDGDTVYARGRSIWNDHGKSPWGGRKEIIVDKSPPIISLISENIRNDSLRIKYTLDDDLCGAIRFIKYQLRCRNDSLIYEKSDSAVHEVPYDFEHLIRHNLIRSCEWFTAKLTVTDSVGNTAVRIDTLKKKPFIDSLYVMGTGGIKNWVRSNIVTIHVKLSSGTSADSMEWEWVWDDGKIKKKGPYSFRETVQDTLPEANENREYVLKMKVWTRSPLGDVLENVKDGIVYFVGSFRAWVYVPHIIFSDTFTVFWKQKPVWNKLLSIKVYEIVGNDTAIVDLGVSQSDSFRYKVLHKITESQDIHLRFELSDYAGNSFATKEFTIFFCKLKWHWPNPVGNRCVLLGKRENGKLLMDTICVSFEKSVSQLGFQLENVKINIQDVYLNESRAPANTFWSAGLDTLNIVGLFPFANPQKVSITVPISYQDTNIVRVETLSDHRYALIWKDYDQETRRKFSIEGQNYFVTSVYVPRQAFSENLRIAIEDTVLSVLPASEPSFGEQSEPENLFPNESSIEVRFHHGCTEDLAGKDFAVDSLLFSFELDGFWEAKLDNLAIFLKDGPNTYRVPLLPYRGMRSVRFRYKPSGSRILIGIFKIIRARYFYAYPNPWIPEKNPEGIRIEFFVPEDRIDKVKNVFIYDLFGHLVAKLPVNDAGRAGIKYAFWNGKNQAGIPVDSGGYICYIPGLYDTERKNRFKIAIMR